ncbi:phage major capsid protein [Paenibacillus sp. 19GGS1-52]|uniref:phage major capsid protein n=1 Tax=Paenibacillus sp. 19GGS1-52 TaxID=2758563 RepID=UPI001EFC27B1|nr:phage major capsid protein [Paenibacillus sp. 19GGS1-52]ULO08928.1 phage major capsid protein [Paenibacillus sp. 19GGS1-52]
MSKELRELLAKLEQRKTEVRSFLAQDKTKEAEEAMEEVRSMQAKAKMLQEMENEERSDLGGGIPLGGNTNLQTREDVELESEYRSIFLRGLRRQDVTADMRSVVREYERRAVMNEGQTNPAIPQGDSSLLVPKDIQTQINTIERSLNDLSMYVNMQYVNTLSGTRVLEEVQSITPFAPIDEYGIFPEMDNPKFRPVDYKVKKYGGILPLTNDLLADSDQNVINYVSAWIANKAVFTRNKLIIDLLNTMDKQALANFAAVKKVINVNLDPAISLNATILTNQDGYNWLDEQVDGFGRPLLTDDITQAGRKLFKGRPIVPVSNRILPSNTVSGLAPMIIGDLKQQVVCFCRKLYELASTKEGGDAFRRDTTDLRAITRCDTKMWDTGAAIFGQLDISEEA